jgi:arginase family enzyme
LRGANHSKDKLISKVSRKIKLFGIPSNAGCLEQGTEKMPEHFRKHGIVEALSAQGVLVEDLGDVPLASFHRHNNSAIRNFPAPQMVWERTESFFETACQPSNEDMIVCVGGDCSIIVGTVAGMNKSIARDDIHILYLDGDIDSIAPDPKQCMGSAGMGLWLLTQKSEYRQNLLTPSQITVIGNKEPPKN